MQDQAATTGFRSTHALKAQCDAPHSRAVVASALPLGNGDGDCVYHSRRFCWPSPISSVQHAAIVSYAGPPCGLAAWMLTGGAQPAVRMRGNLTPRKTTRRRVARQAAAVLKRFDHRCLYPVASSSRHWRRAEWSSSGGDSCTFWATEKRSNSMPSMMSSCAACQHRSAQRVHMSVPCVRAAKDTQRNVYTCECRV